MSILIESNGVLTTIQDLGRSGYKRFGINPNGAMDKNAARLINILLGNKENEAVLEMHFPAAQIFFEQEAFFALGGANFNAEINGKRIENWRAYRAEEGDVLKFSDKIFGNRVYLSVKGGFRIEKWLESASTNLAAEIGGFGGRALKKGDRIIFKEKTKIETADSNLRISNKLIPFYSRFPTVRVTAGAEFSLLTALSEQNFLNKAFRISAKSDRMGFRLQGEPLHLLHRKEMLSSAVGFGTIQLLPDGQMIVLMADHQTTGGYPRLAHIIQTDLPLVAQLGAGDKIGFHLISVEQAENLLLDFEKDLNFFRVGCKFAVN